MISRYWSIENIIRLCRKKCLYMSRFYYIYLENHALFYEQLVYYFIVAGLFLVFYKPYNAFFMIQSIFIVPLLGNHPFHNYRFSIKIYSSWGLSIHSGIVWLIMKETNLLMVEIKRRESLFHAPWILVVSMYLPWKWNIYTNGRVIIPLPSVEHPLIPTVT